MVLSFLGQQVAICVWQLSFDNTVIIREQVANQNRLPNRRHLTIIPTIKILKNIFQHVKGWMMIVFWVGLPLVLRSALEKCFSIRGYRKKIGRRYTRARQVK